MLTTDAYAYLNVADPICAWATYRGALVSAGAASGGADAGAISIMSAGLMRVGNQARISNELVIESLRRLRYPNRVSRLRGMYCFLDIESAQRAAALWGARSGENHFRPENLAELHLLAVTNRERLDSNWISYAKYDEKGFLLPNDITWIDRYWQGQPFPDKHPIWETIIEGRLIVLGTDLRSQAYETIKREFPNSLGVLEIARKAAWVESGVGNICAWLTAEGENIAMHYLMDWREANSPEFIKKLEKLDAEGHPTNWNDLGPHLKKGSFGNLPDLGPYEFVRPRSAMPYVGRATAPVPKTRNDGRSGMTLDMKPSVDGYFRIQGRLNALENLLRLLVFDRAMQNENPIDWIKQYIANLRRDLNMVSLQSISAEDSMRLTKETKQANLEFADLIEAQMIELVRTGQLSNNRK